jgi:hypothetical protein
MCQGAAALLVFLLLFQTNADPSYLLTSVNFAGVWDSNEQEREDQEAFLLKLKQESTSHVPRCCGPPGLFAPVSNKWGSFSSPDFCSTSLVFGTGMNRREKIRRNFF